jgi:hypothetical protein
MAGSACLGWTQVRGALVAIAGLPWPALANDAESVCSRLIGSVARSADVRAPVVYLRTKRSAAAPIFT